MRRIVTFGLSAAVMLFALSAFADTIYIWTDENGVKHYSNSQPPEDVERIETIEGVQYDDASGNQHRDAYDRMVRKAAQEADRHFEDNARKEAERIEAEKQKEQDAHNQQVAAERAKLLQQIEEIKSRGYSATFTKGMQDNLIRQLQEKLDQLKPSMEGT